jgi:small-conductance mechanosensitive channel
LVESFEKREIMIPNEEFITSRISNWTFSNRLGRGQLDLGVAYGSDLEKVNELLLELANNHPQILSEPGPSCYITEFADSSINFRLYFWVGNITEGTLRAKSDLLFSIAKKFKEHGIEIPFPQREVKVIGLTKVETIEA